MKNILLSISCIAAGCVLMAISFAAWGAGASFSPPIPARSDLSQTNNGPETKVDATSLMFFSHPPASDLNYVNDAVHIDNIAYPVSDLVATPGLLPAIKPLPTTTKDGINFDPYGPRDGQGLNPLHGFCPPLLESVDAQGQKHTMNLDCQVGGIAVQGAPRNNIPSTISVPLSRELEVVDIRDINKNNPYNETELVDQGAIIDAIIGSGHESKLPYEQPRHTYPATVISPSPDCQPLAVLPTGVIPDERGDCPFRTYDEVIAYGLADLADSVVAASYDPLMLMIQVSSWQDGNFVSTARQSELTPFFSPNIFFRKDAAAKRLRLAGYSGSTYQLLTLTEKLKGVADPFSRTLTMMPVSNFNPVAVVPLKDSSFDGFAVVNQATVLDLDHAVMTSQGAQLEDPNDQQNHPVRDYILYKDGGSYKPLDETKMPHRVFSYVTFSRRNGTLGSDPADVDTFNPNSAFTPAISAIVGPGMFGAAALTDEVQQGSPRQYLVVASGEAAAGKFYLYKVDPVAADYLYVDYPFDAAHADARQVPITLPEYFEIEVPAGFAPYNIVSANLNNDQCGDVVVTFRGEQTVVAASGGRAFMNEPGQTVRFQAGPAYQDVDMASKMFANDVRIYLGKMRNNNRCGFESVPDDSVSLPMIGPLPQVASVAVGSVADLDADGKVDLGLVIGDLIPRRTGILCILGRCSFSAHVYLYKIDEATGKITNASRQSPRPVRVGFVSVTSKVEPADIVSLISGQVLADKTIGVGALAIDSTNDPSSIAAINGAPLALPPFGCTRAVADDVYVFSRLERMFNGGNINIPTRCRDPKTPFPSLRYPRGQVMHGPREMTVVVNMSDPCDTVNGQCGEKNGQPQVCAAPKERCFFRNGQCECDCPQIAPCDQFFQWNNATCSCEPIPPQPAPKCGDSILDLGEECEWIDNNDRSKGMVQGSTCQGKQTCLSGCKCGCPARAVINCVPDPVTCECQVAKPCSNFNKRVDLGTEQCDLGGFRDDALLHTQCDKQNPDPNNQILKSCDMGSCLCVFEQLACVNKQGVECKGNMDCDGGKGICQSDCTCRKVPLDCMQDPAAECHDNQHCVDTGKGDICLAGCVCGTSVRACADDPMAICHSAADCVKMGLGDTCLVDCTCKKSDITGGGKPPELCPVNAQCDFGKPCPDSKMICDMSAGCICKKAPTDDGIGPSACGPNPCCGCACDGGNVTCSCPPGQGPGQGPGQVVQTSPAEKPAEGAKEGPAPVQAASASRGDCYAVVASYASDASAEWIRDLNKSVAEATGRTDYDLFVENEQKIRIVCVTNDASFPGVPRQRLSLSAAAGDLLADSSEGIGAYSIHQTSGSLFLNFKDPVQMPYLKVQLIDKPVRLAPLSQPARASAALAKALQASAVAGTISADLSGALPMSNLITDMPLKQSGDTDLIINGDMISVQVFSVGANQQMSISKDGLIDKADVAPFTGGEPAPGAAVVVMTLTMPTVCARFTGAEGYDPDNVCAKQPQVKVKDVVEELSARKAPGQVPDSSIFYGLTKWQNFRTFDFIVSQNQVAAKEPQQMARHAAGVLTIDADVGEGAGGCRCQMGSAAPELNSILPAIIAFALALGAIAALRARRRR